MGFFKDMANYFTNTEYLESKGVDTNNPIAVEQELDALKNNDIIKSSLSTGDFYSQQESVEKDGVVDSVSDAIFSSFDSDTSSSDSDSFFSSSDSSSSSSDSGGLFGGSSGDLFGDSDSDDSSSSGWL